MDKNSLLKTEHLGRVYLAGPEKVVALEDVSLKVGRGDFVAVLGPSGSGKTTLLSLLGGLDRPTSGSIYFNGVDISSLEEKRLSQVRRRLMGFVFQNYNLIDELTMLENVELPLLFDGRAQGERREVALKLLTQMGLSEKRTRSPSQLSAGEQQRTAVARALANSPLLVLMDEPTGNLDEDNSRSLMGLVKSLNQEQKVTFILATHNREVAEQASSAIHLKSGRAVPG